MNCDLGFQRFILPEGGGGICVLDPLECQRSVNFLILLHYSFYPPSCFFLSLSFRWMSGIWCLQEESVWVKAEFKKSASHKAVVRPEKIQK